MDIKKSDERYYSVKVMSRLPLSEQLHEANAVLCKEAAEDESVFLERFETQNGHIVLLYRLWRRKNGKSRNKELL
jgi:kynurenine formamidase